MPSRRFHNIRHQRTLLCCIAFVICASQAFGQRADIPKDAIQVRIKLEKSKFHVGEVILFKVIISNVGTQPFLIPNEVSTLGPSHGELNLQVTDEGGKLLPGASWSSDCLSFKPTKLVCETVLSDYLLLRPGTSFVQRTSLEGLYKDLKPGTYHVKSTYYASFSLLGCERWTSEDIEKFPFQPWYGTTAVNEVAFTILPNIKK
jgi:hypothetical protein